MGHAGYRRMTITLLLFLVLLLATVLAPWSTRAFGDEGPAVLDPTEAASPPADLTTEGQDEAQDEGATAAQETSTKADGSSGQALEEPVSPGSDGGGDPVGGGDS
jgi:hypothetical protein